MATIEAASEVFHRVGMQLVDERKAAILKEVSEKDLQGVERKDLQGRDLLTLLMRANMAKDVPDNQRLSDKEVLDRTSPSFSCEFLFDMCFVVQRSPRESSTAL